MAEPMIGRRQFLRILGIAGVGGLLAYKLNERPSLLAGSSTVTETRLLMGTFVNLTLVSDNPATARAALVACLDQMAALEAVFSRHLPDSQVSRLNREGVVTDANPHLVRLLRHALHVSELTEGAFDVTVKPLLDVYEASQRGGHGLPLPEQVQSALAEVGHADLLVENERVAFRRQGMGITVDGIAKGYIVDEGVAVLRAHGFTHVLVEAGGDLTAAGSRSADQAWRVGIQSPRAGGAAFVSRLDVSDRAVATSGDYMQPYSPDMSEHHILDPRTGHSAPELASATIMTAAGWLADALATGLMIMGPVRGLALVDSLPDCEALLVGKDMHVWRSSGLM